MHKSKPMIIKHNLEIFKTLKQEAVRQLLVTDLLPRSSDYNSQNSDSGVNFWYTAKKCCRISKSRSTDVEDSTLLHKGRLNLHDRYQLGSFWSWKPSKVLRNRGKAFRRQWFTSSQQIFTVHEGINVALISTVKKNVNLNPLLFAKNKTKASHHRCRRHCRLSARRLEETECDQLKCSRSVGVSGLEHKKDLFFLL